MRQPPDQRAIQPAFTSGAGNTAFVPWAPSEAQGAPQIVFPLLPRSLFSGAFR